jgi:drug/metabolite transporter (DMT)-like permease
MGITTSQRVQTVLVFGAAVIVAGGNAVAIRISNREIDPLFGAAGRFAVAALVFAAVVAAGRTAWPRGRQLVGAVLYGVLNFGLAYGLIYEGLRSIHAGIAQVILAAAPLATILLAVAFGLEAFSWRRLAGTVVAVLGIAVVSGLWTGGVLGFSLLGIGAMVAAAVSIAAGAVVVKVFPPAPGAALNAIGMAVGAVLLALTSIVTGERWTLPRRAETLAAVGFLIISTIILFAAFLFVIRRWSASATSYQFLLLPIPSVLLSAMLDAEPLTPSLFVGGLLVAVGAYAALYPTKQRREGATPRARRSGGHLPSVNVVTKTNGR